MSGRGEPPRAGTLTAALLLAAAAPGASAGEVLVEGATLRPRGDGLWHAEVTLRHGDTGWEHYADAWRVVGADGTVYGTRTLLHPHEDEQPFTRSLSGIRLPAEARAVWVEAHDNVHGWSGQRLRVELERND